MKTLTHHIEHVRAKPPHIRKQVAFSLALGATALIALLWFGISSATGAFHIQGTSFADAAAKGTSRGGTPVAAGGQASLLGAAGAFSSQTAPAQLQVVGGAQAATPAPASSTGGPTVIPF